MEKLVIMLIVGVVYFIKWAIEQNQQQQEAARPVTPPAPTIDWEALRQTAERERKEREARAQQQAAQESGSNRKRGKGAERAESRRLVETNQDGTEVRQSSISDEVRNRSFEGRTRALAERAAAATSVDDVQPHITEHVQAVFQHQVGRLESTASAPAPGAAPAAASTMEFDFLHQPDSIRQAIIMQEILTRKY